ncbi:hypothetical protein D2Q93_04150 [Alicyclobacillaceae bacterium I2511]|nr:hypothetical protein D2Q93_04150 [Alicyclobacillaceae bacterium I2511]
MSDKLDLILQKLDGLGSRISSIETDITSINATQQQQGNLLTQLIDIVGSTNEKVSRFESKLDAVQVEQDRQGKVLQSLAFRSLEQESEIRQIKQAK